MKAVLHVGCGPKNQAHLPGPMRGPGWQELRYDIDPSVKPDLIGSITDLSGIEDGRFDALYSSHSIEHLFAHEVPVALAEFVRVLKPDGFAIITCPDLQTLGAAIAEGKLVEPLYHSPAGPIAPLDILYGHRPAIAAGNHYMAHKVGFTGPLLVGTMKSSGFVAVTGIRQMKQFALWAIGFRWPADEDEMATYRATYLPQ